ncbi:MAG TPA: LacI family DNA-binding transcriptional regulator [Paracoccus sp. (in: a-proteobacteria)]|uniref:LacI family DNA-binding transcriptional regulator n=1 Tax=uncultured Paracoccus sp. TaxID=189685 RepID=UPI00262C7AFB|nr:LacI family DNA-binding transcriptional regulator [uncultured Paracoccus sp.]HMQ41524.1 LacI family DNA-binding transcriptional regulator [Paracoccus sp. (in: a-proteobacteria)]HMR35479.1 LacI family DNA-binding transcriptional regulator [Paracoccus sp. (in: a-proteobacteria)]
MARKTTAEDVAREAGVSASTVDRVLNGRGGVSKAKEQRVYAAARRLKLDRALNPREARTLRVAAFIQPPANVFHAALKRAIARENRGPNPFNIQIRVFHVDPARPTEAARLVRQVGAAHDALMVCAAHDDRLARVLDGFIAAGMPVVALATDIRCPGAIYVGPDNYRSGRLAGELMGRLLGRQGGEVIVIAGLLAMIGQQERHAGFRDVLRERHPLCKVTTLRESGERGHVAGDLVRRALRLSPRIGGIYNSCAGVGAIAEALHRAGRQGDVVFIAHELTENRRSLLESGAVDVLIDQNPQLEIEAALRAIAGAFGRLDPPPGPTVTPVTILTRENC